ncbi:hypothetical protein [Epilithonimonas vandammei]|uniref:Uncharacterized protein n=1 Tax=Epilithonimonas vandammei TaxID=2487072 RepID=A0A3G8Y7I9_9FLAO|nr:hypothetical protein [Epilithonimonas vandammei]AZI41155.1 hypothetical protein EIB74_14875 [Epilithonimonas vandammei]AZI41161.1 hypothetical protein EIB74_14905 [Epilithonimonas vandammei]
MRNIIYATMVLTALFSCTKNSEAKYFSSEEIENKVFKSVSDLSQNISKEDKNFYIICRYDTLIVMSTKYENTLTPTTTIKKHLKIEYKGKNIVITEPYKPTYNILNEKTMKSQIDNLLPPYYSGNDYQKGVMYKIKDLNNLELIVKGDLRKYFYPMKEYELVPPPKKNR